MEQQKAANETPTEKGAPIIDHSQNIRVATPDSTPDVWIDKLHNYLHLLVEHLNFFRVHLLVFTFVPLFLSIIFWAVNGRFKIEYIDSLFLCYSAFTSTGLSPIDLSRTTPLQQSIIWVQMFFGSPIVVAWVTVLVRKYILASQYKQYMAGKRGLGAMTRAAMSTAFPFSWVMSRANKDDMELYDSEKGGITEMDVHRGMTTGKAVRSPIRRVDTRLKRVDPLGNISLSSTMRSPPAPELNDSELSPIPLSDSPRPTSEQLRDEEERNHDHVGSPLSHEISPEFMDSPGLGLTGTTPVVTPGRSPRVIDFEEPERKSRDQPTISHMDKITRSETLRLRRNAANGERQRAMTYTEIDIRPKRKQALQRKETHYLPPVNERFVTKTSIGFGGFPGPIALARRLYGYILSKLPDEKANRLRLVRPTHSLLVPTGKGSSGQLARYDTKQVPYFSFAAIVGKNSAFHDLTDEELDELGGVEYRALKMLAWLVPAFYICIQALGWIVNPILLHQHKYQDLFRGQWRYVQPSWAGIFLSTSATTNAGMALIDTGLSAFQQEPGVLIITSFQALVGNTAFPVFLRLTIWIGTKVLSHSSEAWATLHFLLDHPRRCFLYLFPSLQTWFLLFIIFILNMIDWSGFLLLDIGNPELDDIPLKWKVLNGLLQATSVRCAGIVSIGLSILAPSVQVLFLIMMYIAPYPIALAVRSTNVYHDRSLGVYEEEESSGDESEQEAKYEHDKRSRSVVFGSYLAWHAKRQLAYDIWWVAGAWLLVAIFERSKIWGPATRQFDLFGILFELISAYGSVGLSLGLSYANYSLSGAWTPASKVILCIVMIRGRSRGLPVAIDRAIMLPKEFGRVGNI